MRADGTVYLNQGPAPGESTVYDGNLVRTEAGRATVSFRRGDLLTLDRESRAAFQSSTEGFLVSLEKGHLAFHLSTPQTVRVEADGLTLRRSGTFPSLAEVALQKDGSVMISVHRGTVSVANLRVEPILVDAGHYLSVSPRLGRAQNEPVGTSAHGKMSLGEKLRTFKLGPLSHNASVGVVVGIVAGAAAVAIAVPLATEPSSPSAP
jgi:hypothetical protein